MTPDAGSEMRAVSAPIGADTSLSATDRSAPEPLLVDCATCRVRGLGCGDCVVTVLLGGPPDGVSLNDDERRAVAVLSEAGLVPPLRLVHAVSEVEVERP